jgi:hypothetical protein
VCIFGTAVRTKLWVLGSLVIALAAIPPVPARGARQGRIAGRVTGPSGRPVKGICVYAATMQDIAFPGSTDARGNYAISVPAGSYVVHFAGCARWPDYSPQWYPGQPSRRAARMLRVRAGETVNGVDARMQVGGRITGRVLTAAGRPPSRGFQVFADGKGSSDAFPISFGWTDSTAPDGSYTIVGLVSGTYLVEFLPGGTGPAYALSWYPQQPDPGHAQLVTVTVGQTTSIGLETLQLPGAITGHVRDRRAHPVAGAVVTAKIREPDGSVYIGASTGSSGEGSYRLGGLAPGEWTVSARASRPHPASARQRAAVQPRVTTRLDFTLATRP